MHSVFDAMKSEPRKCLLLQLTLVSNLLHLQRTFDMTFAFGIFTLNFIYGSTDGSGKVCQKKNGACWTGNKETNSWRMGRANCDKTAVGSASYFHKNGYYFWEQTVKMQNVIKTISFFTQKDALLRLRLSNAQKT
jgi:hypothetical protein